ncbi:hypothetical protein ABK040_004427 [Willaertia magna]
MNKTTTGLVVLGLGLVAIGGTIYYLSSNKDEEKPVIKEEQAVAGVTMIKKVEDVNNDMKSFSVTAVTGKKIEKAKPVDSGIVKHNSTSTFEQKEQISEPKLSEPIFKCLNNETLSQVLKSYKEEISGSVERLKIIDAIKKIISVDRVVISSLNEDLCFDDDVVLYVNISSDAQRSITKNIYSLVQITSQIKLHVISGLNQSYGGKRYQFESFANLCHVFRVKETVGNNTFQFDIALVPNIPLSVVRNSKKPIEKHSKLDAIVNSLYTEERIAPFRNNKLSEKSQELLNIVKYWKMIAGKQLKLKLITSFIELMMEKICRENQTEVSQTKLLNLFLQKYKTFLQSGNYLQDEITKQDWPFIYDMENIKIRQSLIQYVNESIEELNQSCN